MAKTGRFRAIKSAAAPVALALCGVALSPMAEADDLDTALSFTTDFLSVDVQGEEGESPREARFRSGLGMQLRNELLELSVDYKLQSQLRESSGKAAVSQQVGASLSSSALNELLGMKADIKADSTFRDGGNAYAYSITPGISKSLAEFGQFSMQFLHLLDKAGAEALEKEQQGYRMGLEGAVLDGRLTWKGNYYSTGVSSGFKPLQRQESLEFESHYQLAPALQLHVSGFSKDETLFDGGIGNSFYTETRYGVGFAWLPAPRYALAFKVNKRDESREQDAEFFGSGTVSWSPQPHMEFIFSYGDQLVEGARGVMLSTKVDLNGI